MNSNQPAGQTTTNTAPWAGSQPYWSQTYADIFGTPSAGAFGSPQGLSGSDKRKNKAYGIVDPGGFVFKQKSADGSGGVGAPDFKNIQGKYGSGGLLGQTKFVGENQDMLNAYDMVRQRASNPNAMLQGAEGYATDVLSGKFLDPTQNLALAQSLQRGMEDMGAWDTSAQQAGRYGSSAWGMGKGRQLADLQGNLYGQGLQQMTQMAGMAPSIYESGYLPSQKLLALGEQQRQIAQEEQMFPWEMYGMATNMLSGAPGGQQSTPYYKPNPLMGALGGALQGYATTKNPYGAVAGGVAGLLGSQ